MENFITTTPEKLVRAFREWNEDFLANPEEFLDVEIEIGDDCAADQARHLLALLASQ